MPRFHAATCRLREERGLAVLLLLLLLGGKQLMALDHCLGDAHELA
jgi:hypothetical protein